MMPLRLRALHHEVAVPGSRLGQGKSKADAEFLAVYALAAIDNSIDSAVRGKRAETGTPGYGGGTVVPAETSAALVISTRRS